MAFVPPGQVLLRRRRTRTNALWRNWAIPGIVLGLMLGLLGLLLTVLEIARAFIGVDNLGCDVGMARFRFYQNMLQEIFPGFVTLQNLNFPPVNHFIWPWTRPAILFGLILLATGIVGIISGRRRSYSSIVAFLVMSLLSMFLMIYLIAYYSTAVRWFNNPVACNESLGQTRSRAIFGHFVRLGRALLAFSIFAFLATLPAILASLIAISALRRKGGIRPGIRPGIVPTGIRPVGIRPTPIF